MSVRKATASDRTAILGLLGSDERTVDAPGNHLHVLVDGDQVVGAVVWHAPDAGPAMLGQVSLADGRSEVEKDMYRLILATAEDALAQGFETATFTLKKPSRVTMIHRDFTTVLEESGWNPKTKKAVEWTWPNRDLVDAIAQLKAVLDA